jgi:hypothetical protein
MTPLVGATTTVSKQKFVRLKVLLLPLRDFQQKFNFEAFITEDVL